VRPQTRCVISPHHHPGVLDVQATVAGMESKRNAPGDSFTYN